MSSWCHWMQVQLDRQETANLLFQITVNNQRKIEARREFLARHGSVLEREGEERGEGERKTEREREAERKDSRKT